MKSKKLDIVRFAPKGKDSFYETVVAGVKEYFETNQISPYANSEMWWKTIVMLLLYFVPYAFIISGLVSGNVWLFLSLWFVMGMGMSGIGTAVMHDANHGTYSPNKKVNDFISHILEIIGGYKVTWRIQHNVLHHTYTNVDGLDEDIDDILILRFSPRQPKYWFHRYQYLYAWFFYACLTLFWMTLKDYMQAVRYKKHDLLIKQKVMFSEALVRITIAKLFYYAYILVLPMVLLDVPWYAVLTGFLIMHFTGGLFLSCVFQPSHVIETSAFAEPVDKNGKRQMEDSWAVHEVVNTANFAPKSRILSWFIGGLNYQIEHHLFTGICHVHYRKLAPIIQAAATSFGLPYHTQPTFLKALLAHAKMLKKLGKE